MGATIVAAGNCSKPFLSSSIPLWKASIVKTFYIEKEKKKNHWVQIKIEDMAKKKKDTS